MFGWFDSYWTCRGSLLLVLPPFPIALPVPIPHPAACIFCVFSTLPLATLSHLPVARFSCPVHRLLLPVLPLPACPVLCALCCALFVCFLLGRLPPPFPLCVLSCGFLSLLCLFFSPPPCMHARQQCTGHRVTAPVFVSGPLAQAWCAPWRSPAKPGRRPSLASLSSLPSLLFRPRPSCVACLSPALFLLISCSVCSLLPLRTPGLYLAGPHVPLRLCPVLPPIGQLGQPPQVPLWGDSPNICPRRPPLHQFPDDGAWRQVPLNACQWHGVSLCT